MRRLIATSLLTSCTLLAATGPARATTPEGTTATDVTFPSGDGTELHADLIRPKGVDKSPVILSIGPYFNHSGQTPVDLDPTASGPNERFADLYTQGKIFEKGYALVQVDLPGFGASKGCNDFGGPAEQAAVKAAVEWAAGQPWSTGKVGMWGKSYDGWTEVMALAGKPKGLAAAVIMSPIIDGYRTLYQNGLHYGAGWYATPGIYQASDAQPSSFNDSPDVQAANLTSANPACYSANLAQQSAITDKADPFWQARDLVPRAAGSSVPVLWSHGFIDANTKPDNFLDVYGTLTGPHRAWFGQYTHVRPQDQNEDGSSVVGREGFIDEAMRWMDRYVKGVPAAQAPVESDPGVEVEDGGTRSYRAEAVWPPADAVPAPLKLPALVTVINEPGNNGDGRGSPYRTTGMGNGKWTFSQKLGYDVHLSGVPRLTGTATAAVPAALYALLYDISADDKATLVTRSATKVGAAGPIKLDLYPQDWTFKAGHRLGLLLGQADENWYITPTQGTFTLADGALALPFLEHTRTTGLTSKPTADEEEAPTPFDVSSRIAGNETAFAMPPVMTTPEETPLPGTPTGGSGTGSGSGSGTGGGSGSGSGSGGGSGSGSGSGETPGSTAVLPGAGTGTAGPAPQVLSIGLRARRAVGRTRTLVVAGKAPTGTKVVVRLTRGTKTVLTRGVVAQAGRYRLVVTVRRAARYRASATVRSAGTRTVVASKVVRITTR